MHSLSVSMEMKIIFSPKDIYIKFTEQNAPELLKFNSSALKSRVIP